MRFEYECPYCDAEMSGSFGDNVYCDNCDITFETEWDYVNPYEGIFACYLTGEEHKGKVETD